ncbi:hypothetical protein STEG23_027998 [Scotinomys teguina]
MPHALQEGAPRLGARGSLLSHAATSEPHGAGAAGPRASFSCKSSVLFHTVPARLRGEIMPKFKQRRRKLKARAKHLFKKKEASQIQPKLSTPPPPPPTPERVVTSSTDPPHGRNWLRRPWNFRFPSIKDAINLWTHRAWCIYSCCQTCVAQSFEVLKDAIFPSRVYHRELHSLKQQFCVLKSELCKLQEALKTETLKKDGPMHITVKDLLTVKLKKTQSVEERKKLVPSPPEERSPLVTVSDLQRVTLKPNSRVLATRVKNVLITPGKSQIDLRKLLRKVDVDRSPGGTPLTNKENMETGTGLTPVMTRALRRKFLTGSSLVTLADLELAS